MSNAIALARSLATALPMRALVQSGYGGSEVLRTAEAPRPAPGAGEVLVRVHAAAVDRGTWHLMTGRPYLMRIMGFGFRGPKSPVPGLDLAGEVVEVGAGVERFRVGDVVFGIGKGTFAEYACARADKLARAPRAISLAHAAALAVSGGTALQALEAAAVKPGERVLIVGASGGVGTYAVQLAKALGAEVTGVCSASKIDVVRALGADRVIDYQAHDFTADGARYDVVLDVGGNTPLARLRRVMTATARLVFVGGEDGGDFTAGFERQLAAALLGMFVRQRFLMLAAKEEGAVLARLLPFVDAGQVRPMVERSIALGDVPAAIDDLAAGRVRGKIVVQIG